MLEKQAVTKKLIEESVIHKEIVKRNERKGA